MKYRWKILFSFAYRHLQICTSCPEPDSILKSRDITLSSKVRLVKAMVFPVVMYGCESWTTKKAECQTTDDFKLWCWRRFLRVPWAARGSNRSILKEGWCWSWNFNTLATWCEELTHWKRPWRWARLKAGGQGDDRGWDGWMASPTRWTWVWASSGSWWWTVKPGVLQTMGSQSRTWLSDWTDWLTDCPGHSLSSSLTYVTRKWWGLGSWWRRKRPQNDLLSIYSGISFLF